MELNPKLLETFTSAEVQHHAQLPLLVRALRRMMAPSRQECSPGPAASRHCAYRHLYAYGGQFFYLYDDSTAAQDVLPLALRSERGYLKPEEKWLITITYENAVSLLLAASLGYSKEEDGNPVTHVVQQLQQRGLDIVNGHTSAA